MADIHQGDVGTSFRATVTDETGAVLDVSTATLIQFRFLLPDLTTLHVSGGPVSTGSDGRVEYVTTDGDLGQAGRWQVQVYIEYHGGKVFTDVVKFKVLPNIP
jgi:hypothetical protein